MREYEKELLCNICIAISHTIDAIRYFDKDKDESIAHRKKAEHELLNVIDLIKGLPSEDAKPRKTFQERLAEEMAKKPKDSAQ